MCDNMNPHPFIIDIIIVVSVSLSVYYVLCTQGIPFIKHGRQGVAHPSTLYMNETHLFWEGRERVVVGGGWATHQNHLTTTS